MDITSYLLGKQSGGVSPTPVGDKNAKAMTTATTSNQRALTLIEELPTIDFSDAYNCYTAFKDCTALKKAGIKNTKTNINDASSVFQGCSSLTDVDLSEFSFGNITGVSAMFQNCTSIEEIDFSQSGSSSEIVTSSSMFQGCTKLKKILLPTFNMTKEDRNAYRMFYQCTSLELIDISGWDVANYIPTDYGDMFKSVPKTCTIYVKDADAQTWFSTNFPNYTFTIKS